MTSACVASYMLEYRHWINMKSRCNNPNTTGYENWGGRGIRVCDEWINSFETFLQDVGPKPGPGYSIDRFPDKDGNYEPGNVRWTMRIEQARNTRRNSFICYNGQRMSVAEAAERVGINPNTVIYRLRRGWTEENALLPGSFKGQRP